MGKAKKEWTDAMQELRVLLINEQWSIDILEEMATEIAKKYVDRGYGRDEKPIVGYKYLQRAVELGRESAEMHRSELRRIGCRQAGEVGMSVLRDEVNDFFDYFWREKHIA